ncbi:MAG: hypothetical protein R3B06_19085 [Kofleriaceae bacterium]
MLVPHLALADAPAAVAATEPAPAEPPRAVRVATAEPVAAVPAMAVPVEAPPAEAPADTEPVGLARRLAEDAAAGRAFVADTALTTPRGKAVIDGQIPLALLYTTARFGVTDRIEVNASAFLLPYNGGGDTVLPVGFGIKAQLVRTQRVAVSAGVQALTAEGDTVVRPHAAATMCVDQACEASVTLMLNAFHATRESAVPVVGGVGWAIGRRVQFIGELHHWREASAAVEFGVVGARIARANYGLDFGLGFLIAREDGAGDGGALPVFGFSARM